MPYMGTSYSSSQGYMQSLRLQRICGQDSVVGMYLEQSVSSLSVWSYRARSVLTSSVRALLKSEPDADKFRCSLWKPVT